MSAMTTSKSQAEENDLRASRAKRFKAEAEAAGVGKGGGGGGSLAARLVQGGVHSYGPYRPETPDSEASYDPVRSLLPTLLSIVTDLDRAERHRLGSTYYRRQEHQAGEAIPATHLCTPIPAPGLQPQTDPFLRFAGPKSRDDPTTSYPQTDSRPPQAEMEAGEQLRLHLRPVQVAAAGPDCSSSSSSFFMPPETDLPGIGSTTNQ
jgi:hypothetical protein